jgi:hypothetical protein
MRFSHNFDENSAPESEKLRMITEKELEDAIYGDDPPRHMSVHFCGCKRSWCSRWPAYRRVIEAAERHGYKPARRHMPSWGWVSDHNKNTLRLELSTIPRAEARSLAAAIGRAYPTARRRLLDRIRSFFGMKTMEHVWRGTESDEEHCARMLHIVASSGSFELYWD